MVSFWQWFLFFIPLWSSILIAYLYFKKANI